MRAPHLLAVIGLSLVLVSPGFSAGKPKSPPEGDVAHITVLLSQTDASAIDEALSDIRDLLNSQPAIAAAQLRSSWLQSLLNARRAEDTATLAHAAIIELAADTAAVEDLQRLRVRALLNAGKPGEAMAAAKSLFNVCSMSKTQQTLLLCAECLIATHPDDQAIITRFRREQFAGASTQPSSASAPPATVLRSLVIDPAPYAAAIDRYAPDRYVVRSNEFRTLTAEGNLLLLADKPEEARRVFERARLLGDDDQLLAANESIARAIKAQAGSIGPANAWIASLQQNAAP